MRRSSGSRGFERKVRFPSKTLAMYEPSGLVIASSKPNNTKPLAMYEPSGLVIASSKPKKTKPLAMYEHSGLVIASSKPKKTKSWQRLVQVKSGTRCRIAAEDTPRASMADLRSRRRKEGIRSV